MATAKKGKVNAKKSPVKKPAGTKAPAKKAAGKATPVKAATKAAVVQPVDKAPLVTPAKGDIVRAFGKHFLVHTSSKAKGMVVGKGLPMVECNMTGANWYRDIEWTSITAIYKDAGYRG